MCLRCNSYIYSTIYPTNNNMYILELNSLLKTYSCLDGAIITIDSAEISVNPSSPITIENITFSGVGCSGAMSLIAPDKKSAEVVYPNFFSSSSSMQLNQSSCKISITLNINNEYSCVPLILNYLLRGQAIINDDSQAKVIVECHELKNFKYEYANNYDAQLDVYLKKFCC